MKFFVLAVVLVFWSAQALAQHFDPITQPIGNAERIIVRGFKGTLQIVPTESQTLRVEAAKAGKGDTSGWTFEVRQKGVEIEVRVKSSAEQEGWDKVRTAAKEVPTFEMKITAPPIPMEVFWNEGQVFSQGWNSNLALQMTTGNMKFTKGKGNMRLQLVEGRLEVNEQEGDLTIQTYKGQTLLGKNKGSLTVNNHSAVYKVSQHEGPVEFRNHSGSTSLSKIKGHAVIKNVSGAVSLRDFEGNFEGDFQRGALNAKLSQFQNISVNSDDAAITLDVPKDSGAKVYIRTEKGRLWAPIYLGKNKKGRWTERKGRLRGKEQGNIKIVSKYGDIVLK